MPVPQVGVIDERTGQVIPMTQQQQAAAAAPTGFPSTSAAGTPTATTPTTSTGPDPTMSGLQELTGWAGQQGYTPAQLPTLYENPWYVLPDVFKGISMTSPLYQSLRDIGADPLALFQLMMGNQGILDEGAQGQFVNFLQGLYSQLGTPGGQAINTGQLLRNLFGAGEDTSLGQVTGAGDMGTQVRTLFNLVRDATNAGMDPLSARGFQAAMAREGDRYGNEMLKAGSEDSLSFREWAAKNAPWMTGR